MYNLPLKNYQFTTNLQTKNLLIFVPLAESPEEYVLSRRCLGDAAYNIERIQRDVFRRFKKPIGFLGMV